MKKLFTFLLVGLISLTATAQVSFGNADKFNQGWRFILADDDKALNPDFDDSRWRPLTLPHDWSVESAPSQALASCTGYLPGGIGWYRKHFTVSDDAARHYIYFEGVYNRSDVYLNGHHLGHRPNGYVSFMYDLTPYLNKGGDNVIAVRVDHSRYADSRWYTGSGIYRDVYLVSAPDVHLSQWGVAYRASKLTNRSATIEVDVAVDNHTDATKKVEARITMLDAEGKKVASATKSASVAASTTNFQLPIVNCQLKSPHRWNLDAPNCQLSIVN
jgi:beta-galactosidase/beta-glucuronidase